MSEHRFEVNQVGNQMLYELFSLPDCSIMSFKIRILEKKCHLTNDPGPEVIKLFHAQHNGT